MHFYLQTSDTLSVSTQQLPRRYDATINNTDYTQFTNAYFNTIKVYSLCIHVHAYVLMKPSHKTQLNIFNDLGYMTDVCKTRRCLFKK